MAVKTNLLKEFIKSHVKLHEDLADIENEKIDDRCINRIIKENELFHTLIINELPGMVYSCRNDNNWTMEFVSKGCIQLTGYKPADLILNNKISYEEIIHPDDRKAVRDNVEKALKQSKQFQLEYRIVTADKKIKCVSEVGQFFPLPYDNLQMLEGFIMDITDKKYAEELLTDKEEKYRLLFKSSPVGIILLNTRGFITAINDIVLDYTGFSKQDILGRHFTKLKKLSIKDMPRFIEYFSRLLAGKALKPQLISWKNLDGVSFIGEARTSLIRKNRKITGIQVILTDITKRIKTEQELRDSEEFNKSILENSPSPTLVINPDKSVRYVNPALEKITGFSSEENIGIKPPYPYWPKEIIKSCKSKLDHAMKKDMLIPELQFINKNGQRFWVELRTSPLIINRKLKYLLVNFIDITDRKKSFQELEKTFEDTINTLAFIVEKRDPYTSGHQKRVTYLAVKIAKKLKLDNKKIKILKTASIIHDIGKINIPTSILSKTGKLMDIEYNMLKTHPQVGFDIIKNIKFYYPVARIILQHHERENGSGYPNGLKGRDILLEAKIIGVADVVEAMSSHRPYRPALGIKSAIQEITKNKGILYDPQVVDACLKVINSKSFSFDNSE
jgi:PAS domain S-box-containing protein/putative nucleotidyltransferase with HDIG domain